MRHQSLCVIGSLLAGIVSPSAAAELSFQTILDGDSATPAAGATLVSVRQVVLGEDGAVSARVQFDDSVSGFNALSRNVTAGNANAQLIVRGGDSLWGGGGTYGDFTNLAVSSDGSGGQRLTFAARSPSNQFGVFQYDTTGSTQHRSIFEGDSLGGAGPTFSFNTPPVSFGPAFGVVVNVNPAGQALTGGFAAAESQIVLATGTPASMYVNETTSGLTGMGETFSQPIKRVITAAGNGVFLADGTSGRRIMDVASPGSTSGAITERVAESTLIDGATYSPEMLLGASAGGTLYRAAVTSTASSSDLAVLYKPTSGAAQVLGSAYDRATFGIDGTGVLTQQGYGAAYIPEEVSSALAGRIVAIDPNSPTSHAEIAVGEALSDGYTLANLVTSLGVPTAPMVNDNGWIVFDASITGGDLAGPTDALVAWNPTSGTRQVVLHIGQFVEIAGGPAREIFSISQSDLIFDPDVLKDGLNNLNQLAIGVGYYDPSDDSYRSAILMTTIPEPGAWAVFTAVAAPALLLRRRVR